MALTKVTGQVIKSDTNITSHNINSSGIITAVSFSGPLDTTGGNFTGVITATSATFSGNVTIGGTLTYEDVTNIDSLGIVTARHGFRATAGGINVTAGISTFGGNIDANGTLDVDGDTQLDDLNVAGVATFSALVDANNRIDVVGGANIDQLNVSGVSTITKGTSGGATANTDAALIVDNSSHTYVQFRTPATKEQGLLFGDDADNDAGAITYNHSTNALGFRVNANERARIDSSGRIGLGITNPGDYFSSYNRVVMGRTNDTGGMTIVSGTGSGGYIIFADGTSGNTAYRGSIAYQHDGDYMTFGTDGGNERLRIISDGKVGIGITNPSNALDVQGGTTNTAIVARSTDAKAQISLLDNSTTGVGCVVLGAEGDNLFLTSGSGGTEALRITSSGVKQIKNGNLNILSTYIDFSGSLSSTPATAAAIFRPADNTLAFSTANKERLRLTSDGKVGINTTTPYSALEVQGDGGTNDATITFTRHGTPGNDGIIGQNFYRIGTDSVAGIGAYRESAMDDAYIAFHTQPTGGNYTERLRIKSDGGLRLQKNDGNGNFTISRNASVTSTDQPIGVVDFASNTAHTVQARVMGKTRGTSNVGGDLVVEARADGGSLDERFRITGSGLVGVNTATGGASSNAILSIHSPSSSACRFNLTNNGSSSAESTQIWSQNNDLVFNTGGGEKLRINSDGRALFDRGAPASANKTIARFQCESSRKLDIVWHDSGSLMGFDTPGGHALIFKLSGTEKLRLLANGQILHSAGSGDNQITSKRTNAAGSDGNYFFHLKATDENDNTVGTLGFHRDTAADDARLVLATRKTGASNVERLRLNSKGLISATISNGCIDGTYVYKQANQSANYEHKIRGPLGGLIDTEMNTNSVAYIKVQCTGTGTNTCYCYYRWSQDGENLGATLTHIHGNSGSSSNNPWMVLDGQHPCWKTAHSTAYTYVIRVEITGGEHDLTFQSATGGHGANP